MSAKRPKLVGVTGRAQHGKSTIGTVLEQHLGFRQVAFADALRAAMEKMNPIIDASGPSPHRYTDVIHSLGYEKAKTQYAEVRRLLQVFGTEVVRDLLGESAWVDALDRTIFDDEDELEQFVITDVRFPNEAEYVRRNNGVLVKVVRPNFDNGVAVTHTSESLVDTLPYDYLILNNSSLEDLAMAAVHTMQMEHTYPKARWQRGGELEASTAS